MHERLPKLQMMRVTDHNDAADRHNTVFDSFYISLIVYINRLIAYLHKKWFRRDVNLLSFWLNTHFVAVRCQESLISKIHVYECQGNP